MNHIECTPFWPCSTCKKEAEDGARSGRLDKLIGHYSRYAAYGDSIYARAYRRAHNQGRNLTP